MNQHTALAPAGFIDPALASPEDEALRQELRHVLAEPTEHVEPEIALILHLSRGDSPVDVPLPSAWSAEILHALAALIAGRGVAWSSNTETEDEIGTGEVAEMLGVSPPTVMAMLDRGEISMRLTPGGHRRVRRADVLQWRVRREIQRRSLRELVQMAERDESEGPSLPSSVQQDPDDE